MAANLDIDNVVNAGGLGHTANVVMDLYPPLAAVIGVVAGDKSKGYKKGIDPQHAIAFPRSNVGSVTDDGYLIHRVTVVAVVELPVEFQGRGDVVLIIVAGVPDVALELGPVRSGDARFAESTDTGIGKAMDAEIGFGGRRPDGVDDVGAGG